ncbi:MAG: hypothetical protein KatS3mg053_0547 [Candidatus Roseilinea sp.]|nr:MAG: hypothetical protein KatS3mg053_0547 [Candidatus Roseilinea sp.]
MSNQQQIKNRPAQPQKQNTLPANRPKPSGFHAWLASLGRNGRYGR